MTENEHNGMVFNVCLVAQKEIMKKYTTLFLFLFIAFCSCRGPHYVRGHNPDRIHKHEYKRYRNPGYIHATSPY